MSKDELGLTLSEAPPFTLPPSVILYGEPGIGKSTEAAKAFQSALYIETKYNILAPYQSWWTAEVAKDASVAQKFRPTYPIPGLNPKWTMARYDLSKEQVQKAGGGKMTTLQFFEGLIDHIEVMARTGKRPYKGIVIDEMTDLSTRLFEDLKAGPAGKNGWKMIEQLKTIHRKLIMLTQRTGMYLVLVCHTKQPDYWPTDDDSIAPAVRGKLKYQGGPAFAIGTIASTLCADADFVVQLEARRDPLSFDPTKGVVRTMLTETDPLWLRKARDFRIPAISELSTTSLRTLLGNAGLDF